MNVNIYYKAFKHSHVFRKMDHMYLRYVSMFMEQKIFMPGHLILQAGELKQQMFYIVKGEIEVLSKDDEHTPLLTFTSGTCLGESTLFMPYYSDRFIRAKSFCIIQRLTRDNFLRTIHGHHEQFKQCHQLILQRYEFARKHEKLTRNLTPENEHDYSRAVLCLRWLKYTLTELLEQRQTPGFTKMGGYRWICKVSPYKYETPLYDRLLFIGNYLDMLVLINYAGYSKLSKFFIDKFGNIVI